MAIEFEFVVTLRDLAGAPLSTNNAHLIGDVSYALEPDGDGRQRLVSTELGSGRYQLRVDLVGRPQLRLQLDVSREGDSLELDFVGRKPRCCELRREATITQLDVTLGPSHEEMIFVAGWDYSGGAQNARWSMTWRDDLYAGATWLSGSRREIPRQIHDHTVVTMFDFQTGERVQQLKADKGWHDCDRALQGSVPTHLGSYKDEEANQKRHADDSISIVHIYQHIIELGRQSPGCVRGLHMFSHAWAGGPILVNTDQARQYAHSPARDPGDKDGRTKDFSERNMPEREHFAAAFAPEAIAKIWGCYATTLYRRMVRAAAKSDDPDKLLTVRYGDEVRKLTAAQIESELLEDVIGNSYMTKLARTAGITVYGAPPGMGSNLKRVGKRYYMFVKPRVFALEYRWFKDVLGLDADISGHFGYEP